MSRTYKDAPTFIKLKRDFEKYRLVEHNHENIGRKVYTRDKVYLDGEHVSEQVFNMEKANGIAAFEEFTRFLQSKSISYDVRKYRWFGYASNDTLTVTPFALRFVYEFEDHCTEAEIEGMFEAGYTGYSDIFENGKHAPCIPIPSRLEYKKADRYNCKGFCSEWSYSSRSKNKTNMSLMKKAYEAGFDFEDMSDINDFTNDDKAHSCWC